MREEASCDPRRSVLSAAYDCQPQVLSGPDGRSRAVPNAEPRTRTPQVTGGAVRELARKPRPR